jgi:hypothetical protein
MGELLHIGLVRLPTETGTRKRRPGEIGFYIIAASLALTVALPQRSSVLAMALFIAIAAFVCIVALEV